MLIFISFCCSAAALQKEKSVVEVHDLLNQTLQEHTLEVTIVNEQMKTSVSEALSCELKDKLFVEACALRVWRRCNERRPTQAAARAKVPRLLERQHVHTVSVIIVMMP